MRDRHAVDARAFACDAGPRAVAVPEVRPNIDSRYASARSARSSARPPSAADCATRRRASVISPRAAVVTKAPITRECGRSARRRRQNLPSTWRAIRSLHDARDVPRAIRLARGAARFSASLLARVSSRRDPRPPARPRRRPPTTRRTSARTPRFMTVRSTPPPPTTRLASPRVSRPRGGSQARDFGSRGRMALRCARRSRLARTRSTSASTSSTPARAPRIRRRGAPRRRRLPPRARRPRLRQHERPRLRRGARPGRGARPAVAKAGVDAVIVQDVGLVELVRRVAPNLAIHGSTQMSITSPRAPNSRASSDASASSSAAN